MNHFERDQELHTCPCLPTDDRYKGVFCNMSRTVTWISYAACWI